MKNFLAHTRTYIIRGLLASIPIFFSYLVIKLIYEFIDKKVTNLIDVDRRIPGLGVLLVLIVLYLIGLLTSNVIGRRFFSILEGIFNRIPILKTTYQIGKQVSSSFSLPEKQVFKKVVLVDYFKNGVWGLGFVTGIVNGQNEKLVKVFIPTVPNPTTGFVILVQESCVRETGWSVEEGMRTIISGGIIGPEQVV